MCARYSLTVALEVLEQMFDVPERPNLAPRWNIAPTQHASVITRDTAGNHLRSMRWGFARPNNTPLINARSETVAVKPSFREAFATRRCLVPADGFYEWQLLHDKRKQPWRIGMKGGDAFAFAGLWEAATDKLGQAIEQFIILTTSANAYLAPLHERMPVIVAPKDYGGWLTSETAAKLLLHPYPAEPMARYRVKNTVNSVGNDSPACFIRMIP